MSMKHLKDLSKEEQNGFIDSFDVILSDVDGVLFKNIVNIIAGAPEAVKNLRLLGKKIYFVTNGSYYSIEEQLKRFKDFQMDKDQIIRPALSVIWYLKKLKFDKEIYLVGFPSLKNELEEAGFKVISDEVKPGPDSVDEWASIVNGISPNVGAVVMDFCLSVHYTQLQRCIEYINVNKAVFLLGAGDREAPLLNSTVIACLPFANIVTDFTGIVPQILGKPGKALGQVLKENLGFTDPKRVLFIGDSIEIDLGFAANCGYQKLLTLTGMTKAEDLSSWKQKDELKPDYVMDSIKDLELITSRILQG